MVSQDTFIFNGTVRENIAYGLSDATEADVTRAAQFANALEFVQALPQGFETNLGDRGVRALRWAAPADCDRPSGSTRPGNFDFRRSHQCFRFCF